MADAQPSTTAPSNPAQTGQMNIQVNLDYLKTTRVHMCMPCYGGQLTESTFMSYIKWANTARQLGLDWTVETMTNESLISRARNTLTAKFLHTKESTHLMFIDADIGWEPWHLLVMLDAQKDVIGGLYPMKSLPIKWCVNGIPGQPEPGPEDNLIEAKRMGIPIKLPHINDSDKDFKIEGKGIRFGLSAIKYISDTIADRYIAARPFKSFKEVEEFTFTKGNGVNSRALQAMNAIGALTFPDNPADAAKVKENLYEYLNLPEFNMPVPQHYHFQLMADAEPNTTDMELYYTASNGLDGAMDYNSPHVLETGDFFYVGGTYISI